VIEALQRSEPVRAVRAALEDGPPSWLVGGAVRDALLGRGVSDVDVAVDGDAETAARMVARAVRGPVFPLSEDFGAWRVVAPGHAYVVDLSPLQGATIEEDLARRDFSINAMAAGMADNELLDLHGGVADLAARTLRVLGPGAYADDPLRALRLARLAAELGFTPEAETERLTRAAAPRLSEPSPERVFAELRRLVCADGVLEGLELAARLGVLGAVLPELTELQGIEQSRFHHLDVYRHTIDVLRQLMALEADPSVAFGELAPAVSAVLDEPLADEMSRGQALRLGALFHDIAKPATRGERADGRVTFIGHDSAGEQMSREILGRLRASTRLRDHVAALTRHHLVLGFMLHDRPLSPRDLHRYLRRCEPVEVDVTVLSCADRMATRGEGQEPWIAGHLELAEEVMAAALAWREEGPPRPPLPGDQLARELDIEPGPELGALLAQLEEAVYAGEVSTREEAVAYARRVRQTDRR
jgi:poly(A) polymerase